MILEVPVSSDSPDYTLQMTLDGGIFYLHFYWVEVDAAWYLDLSDAAGVLAAGRRLVADWPLIHRLRDARRPKGELMVVTSTGDGATPAHDDLGTSAKVVYLDAAELGRA